MHLSQYLVGFVLFCSAAALRFLPEIATLPVFTYISVVLIALPSMIVLYRWLSLHRFVLTIFVLAVFAYGIESVGIITGFPYGEFSYGVMMGAKLFGIVPVLLVFAYLPLVFGAQAIASRIFKPYWARVLAATIVLVLFDLVLDPGAVAIGLWSFSTQGAYYGVPFTNFVGWVISGIIVSTLFVLCTQKHFVPYQLVSSAFLMLCFYAGVAVFFSLVIPAVLAAILLTGIIVLDRQGS